MEICVAPNRVLIRMGYWWRVCTDRGCMPLAIECQAIRCRRLGAGDGVHVMTGR